MPRRELGANSRLSESVPPKFCRLWHTWCVSSLQRQIGKHRRKPPGRCIFCGGGSLSREHIWPKWAATLLPDSTGAALTTWEQPVTATGPPPKIQDRSRQGSLKNHRVRAVCRSCNNTWMSQLEEAVRASLTALMEGRPLELADAERDVLAAWITLKVMVAEHDRPELAAFTSNELAQFREGRHIPPHLSLWLYGSNGTQWRSAYYRSSFTMWRSLTPPRGLTAKNVAAATFGIGGLLVFSVYDAPGILSIDGNAYGGQRLWPPSEAPVIWPPVRRLDDTQALDLAHAVERITKDPRIAWRRQ